MSALGLAVLLAVAGQNPALVVDAKIDPRADGGQTVAVGAPFSLIIEAEHTPGTIALLPADLGLPEALAERRSARAHERTTGEAKDRDVYVLELLAFEAGEHQIPPIPLAMGSTTAKTPALTVRVASTLSEDEQLVASSTRPEAIAELERMAAAGPPPERVMVPDYTLFWVIGISALLIAGTILLLRLAGKRKPARHLGPPPPPPRPAHEVAEEALAKLRAEDPLGKGAFKAHYTELSTILRRYVGERYGFESLELTHDELISALEDRRPAGLDVAALDGVLFAADQVKFAKFVPLAEDGYEALGTAEKIVGATKPRPAPEEEAKE